MLAWLALAAAQTPTPAAPPAESDTPTEPNPDRVEIVYQETVAFPEDFAGDRPLWKTNRYGQALLVDTEGKTFALDQAGRALRPATSDEAVTAYRFPMKYFDRWGDDWIVVEGESSVPLDRGPDFTGAYLATRWGQDRREALVRLDRDALAVYSVTPPRSHRDYPPCFASVPESCLASGVQILKEYAGDPKAERIALSQVRRACDDGVVRACFIGVSLEGGKLAEPARSCLDGEAESCAVVAGSVYAEARLEGASSKAGERMLEHACDRGVAAACSEAAQMFDERDLPHNALLMLDRACVSGDRAACDEVETRRDEAFATGIARACDRDPPDPVGCITLAQFLEDKPIDSLELDAFEAWKRACSGGEDPACQAMAPYVDRWGVDHPRVQTAMDELLGDCNAGGTGACVGAAHLLVRLDTRDPRYARARELYSSACTAGSNAGCLAGAATSWTGPARRLELPDREALYRTACERDDATACAGLGAHLARDRRDADAIPPLEKGCELGSASACTELGKLVQSGVHAMEVEPEAVFRQGCEDGDAEACFQLGRTLSRGETTDPATEAFAAYRSGCEAGQIEACEQTGLAHLALDTHYEAGIASGYLDGACQAGQMRSCRALASLYRTGFGVERDRKRARRLLQEAGELEPRKHVRLGGRVGFLNILGVDGEIVLPIPQGPAISVGGDFSFLPGQGLSMAYVGPTIRVYPSHSARGLYAAAGWHQFRITAKDEVTTNAGFNGRVGVRVQKDYTFGGVEIGLASVDAPRVQDLIRPIPLVVPVFGLSGGVAFL